MINFSVTGSILNVSYSAVKITHYISPEYYICPKQTRAINIPFPLVKLRTLDLSLF